MPKGAGEWKADEGISASKLNANDKLNMRNLRVGPGLGMQRNANSGDATITLDPNAYRTPIVRAYISTYPSSSPSSTSWQVCGVTPWDGVNINAALEVFCKVYYPQATGDRDFGSQVDILITQPYGGVTDDVYFPAQPLLDPYGNAVTWEMISTPWDIVTVTVLAIDATRQGWYTGLAVRQRIENSSAAIKWIPCQIQNIAERGHSTNPGGWALTPGTYSDEYAQPGAYLGRIVDTSNGELVVNIEGIPGTSNYHVLTSGDVVYMQGGLAGGIQSMGVEYTPAVSVTISGGNLVVTYADVKVDTMGVVRVVSQTASPTSTAIPAAPGTVTGASVSPGGTYTILTTA